MPATCSLSGDKYLTCVHVVYVHGWKQQLCCQTYNVRSEAAHYEAGSNIGGALDQGIHQLPFLLESCARNRKQSAVLGS